MKFRLITALLVVLSVAAGGLVYQVTRSDFSTLNGQNYRWESLQGQWVVINYFAPWCAPCLREMPELHHFDETAPENTKVFAINFDVMTKDALANMVAEYDIALDVIIVDEATLLPMEKPTYLPATFIVDPDGKVVDTIMGEVSSQLLFARLEQLQSR